jgi:hypothetical protein
VPDAIGVGDDLAIGETDDTVPNGSEEPVAFCVIGDSDVGPVGVSVQLDYEFGLVAGKIDEIPSYRDLPTKSNILDRPQQPPHVLLGHRRGVP